VAQNKLGLNAHSGLVIVFRAKRADRIKVLLWDGTGLVMAYKRLRIPDRDVQNERHQSTSLSQDHP